MTAAHSVGRIVSFNAGQKPSKFGNKKTIQNGQIFDSRREASRYAQLLLLERNGELRNIRRQVLYELRVNNVLIAKYYADFVYEQFRRATGWEEIVEDVKGYPNDRWPMKKKLMLAIFNVKVLVTK